MTITIRDVVAQQKKAFNQREIRRNVIPGKLVLQNGNITVPGRPNYVYFLEHGQPQSGPPAVVFNDAVQPINNLPVLVGVNPNQPYQREVIEVYKGGLIENTQQDSSSLNIGPHAPTHQYPSESTKGSDAVLIYQPALQMCKVTSGGGLTINVEPLIYNAAGQRYYYDGDTAIDVSSYLPGVGEVVRVLVYLDTYTNTPAFIVGTSVPDDGVSIPNVPIAPVGSIPLASLYLTNGLTDLVNGFNIEDARPFLTPIEDTTSLTLPDPEAVGDILVSLDGATWEPVQIVTDVFGDIVTSGGQLVVV